ncbi:endonuclease/exonuclease/phosphatase family protein [Halomonas sp. V046]|uniref:endonuclease/exonuclease/phosphatase family protein n=1 Tax=Halomonas sp. V046 TaxID=3459611 RepID=UPI0040449FAF
MTSLADVHPPTLKDGHLKLLTFNLQVGIQTSAYHHYLTRSWQHLLPHPKRMRRLDVIAEVLSRFDVVGLQEVDGGSIRSSQVNQLHHLATTAGFPHHYQQLNRNLGRFGQHSNGLLSRLKPSRIEEHRLPGTLPGRGAIHATFGNGPEALHLFVCHLALGQRTQTRQLDYLSECITPLKHVVVMGDLNCTPDRLQAHSRLYEALPLHPVRPVASYPAWQPRRALDHILLSSSLEADDVEVLDHLFSDHLPVAIDIRLPKACLATIDTGAAFS